MYETLYFINAEAGLSRCWRRRCLFAEDSDPSPSSCGGVIFHEQPFNAEAVKL